MAGQGNPPPKEEEMIFTRRRPWGDGDLVPFDVLHSVALRLSPPDLSNFQKVCRLWRNMPMESCPLSRCPLLFCTNHLFRLFDELYLYSPLYNRTFSLATSPEVLRMFNAPSYCTKYSKDGWLAFYTYDEDDLAHRNITYVNPFLLSTDATAIIKWKMPIDCSTDAFVSMSAPPTDSTCIFLVVDTFGGGFEIIAGDEGGENWNVDFFDFFDFGKIECDSCPVFHGGVFYILGCSGAGLGMYDPLRRTWETAWVRNLGSTMEYYSTIPFLVESDGELLGIFRLSNCWNYNPPICPIVYKLNLSSMEWEELTELRGRALFLCPYFAMSAMAEVEGMKDRIFDARFPDITIKTAGELHLTAGGEPRFIPRPDVGFAKLVIRAEGEMVGRSHRCNLDATSRTRRIIGLPETAKEKKVEKRVMDLCFGVWIQP